MNCSRHTQKDMLGWDWGGLPTPATGMKALVKWARAGTGAAAWASLITPPLPLMWSCFGPTEQPTKSPRKGELGNWKGHYTCNWKPPVSPFGAFAHSPTMSWPGQYARLGGAQQGGHRGAMRVGQSTVEIKKAETQEMGVE